MLGGSGVYMSDLVNFSRPLNCPRKSINLCPGRVATWVRGSTVEDSSAAITRPGVAEQVIPACNSDSMTWHNSLSQVSNMDA